MSAGLRLVASTTDPEPVPSPRVRTVYVLAGTPEEVGRAVTEAMSALADRRPRLTIAGGAR